MSGLPAGDTERRVEAPDLVVEGASSLFHGRREGVAEGEEPGFDLHPGALRAVGGALARGPAPLQPVGLLPQALRPLEEGGVLPGVLRNEGSRLRGQVRLPSSTAEEPAEHAPGGPREVT